MTEKVFRLKGNVNLWDYLEGARKRAWIAANKRLSEIYAHWLASPDNELTIRKELGVPPNIQIQQQHCTIYLNILYDQMRLEANAPFNLDAKIRVQRFMQNGKSRYALIPESSGVFSDIFDFMDQDKELTSIWFDEDALATSDFLLENNVTEDEWIERAEIYVEMLESPYDVLTMEIVNQKIILDIDPNLDNVIEKLILDTQGKEDIIESDVDDSSEESLEEPQEELSEEEGETDAEEMNFEVIEDEDGIEDSEELDLDLELDDCEENVEAGRMEGAAPEGVQADI